MILEGFQTVLAPHYEIVGAVTDGKALLEAATRLKPDLIVLDITMPLVNGLKAATEIRKQAPRTQFLFVTMHASPTYLQAAMNVGGRGFVVKSSAREEILTAVDAVLKGRIYVTPGVAAPEVPGTVRTYSETSLRLTGRENEILQRIAEGRTSKEIAETLHISLKTVAFHRENIKNKLGLRSTAELTRYAIQEALV